MKKILLDTNAYTRMLTGDDSVLNVVASAEAVFMSILVLGELYAGFAGPRLFHRHFLIDSAILCAYNCTHEDCG